MNPTATVPAFPPPETGGRQRHAISVAAGLAFTLSLFWGIAYHNRLAVTEEPAAPEPLETVALAEPPPPPPLKTETAPEVVPEMGFILERSDSPLKISVSPPSPGKILPEDLSKAPPAHARTAVLTGKFQARTGFLADPRHVYQRHEVDQIPIVVSRGDMSVPDYLRGASRSLSVMLLVIVNADGSIGPVSLGKASENPKFDVLMMEKIHRWVFTPASKGGRKVRCLIGQPVTVRFTGSDSPFQR